MALKIGFLSIAHMHAESYAAALHDMPGIVGTVGVHDGDRDLGMRFAETFGFTFVEDPQALIDQSDGVIVTSANAHHRRWVEAALSSKKPVLCEKPLAVSLQDGAFLVETSLSTGVPLYMALPVRFVPSAQDLRRLLQSGQLGRIAALVGTNHGMNPGGWFTDRALAGGGAVADHTPHVADLMRWLMDSDVVSVYAEIGDNMYQAGIDDSGILTLEFANGAIATLDPSWSRLNGHPAPVDVTLEVIGTEGVAHWDAFRPHLDLYGTPGVAGKRAHQVVRYGADMDRALVAEFLAAVASGRPGPTLATGRDGLAALAAAHAAYESSVRGCPVAPTQFSF
jgi:predicted dehydrogenase